MNSKKLFNNGLIFPCASCTRKYARYNKRALWEAKLQLRATNKASIGLKAALGLRQIAALMAPSASSLHSQPSCRQCGNFLLCWTLVPIQGLKKESRA
jgi:hypothetical protein